MRRRRRSVATGNLLAGNAYETSPPKLLRSAFCSSQRPIAAPAVRCHRLRHTVLLARQDVLLSRANEGRVRQATVCHLPHWPHSGPWRSHRASQQRCYRPLTLGRPPPPPASRILLPSLPSLPLVIAALGEGPLGPFASSLPHGVRESQSDLPSAPRGPNFQPWQQMIPTPWDPKYTCIARPRRRFLRRLALMPEPPQPPEPVRSLRPSLG